MSEKGFSGFGKTDHLSYPKPRDRPPFVFISWTPQVVLGPLYLHGGGGPREARFGEGSRYQLPGCTTSPQRITADLVNGSRPSAKVHPRIYSLQRITAARENWSRPAAMIHRMIYALP